MSTRRDIIRFLITGVLVGATDFGLYYFLINFLSFSLAKAIAYTCASIVAYLFNKHWIFQCKQPSSCPQVGRYLIVSFLALGINVLINQSILNMFPDAILLALIMASMLTGSLSFVVFKWWVFRKDIQ